MKWSLNKSPFITVLLSTVASILKPDAGSRRLFLNADDSDRLSQMDDQGTVSRVVVDGTNGKDGKDGTNGLADAPSDGKLYGRQNGMWVIVTSQSGGGGGGTAPTPETGKLTGTLIYSADYGGNYSVTRIVDGDITTQGVASPAGSDSWVGFDLGANSVAILSRVRCYPFAGSAGQSQGSNLIVETATNFTGPWTQVGQTAGFADDMTWQETTITGATAARYVRVRHVNDYLSLSELEFYGGN